MTYCTALCLLYCIVLYCRHLYFSKGNALSGEVDESRMLVDTADRARRSAEAELIESRDTLRYIRKGG